MTANSTSRRRGPPRGTHENLAEKFKSNAQRPHAMRFLGLGNEAAETDRVDYEKQHDDQDSQKLPRGAANLASRIVADALPQWLAIGVMLGLIFGGCCSNVYALEAIIKVEPSSGITSDAPSFRFFQRFSNIIFRPLGTLLTFVQFLFVATTGYISQLDRSRPPLFVRPNKVPLRRWMVNIVLFFSINVLNNHAFSYDISVPVHIILRSGGSITTMAAGSLYGKRYSRIQVVAVLLLTVGVIIAAWSDSQAKGVSRAADVSVESAGDESEVPVSKPTFGTGLVVLFVAQILSAIMGLYTEETYKKYGPHWKENLFYCHLLSLPLFLPFIPSLLRQYGRLASSAPLSLTPWAASSSEPTVDGISASIGAIQVPSQLAYLAINVLTQYACIRGVNLLAAASSALTVTIVLNIRKLVSLLLSIWLFGNTLATGTLLGAVVVFGAGGLYSLDSKTKPTRAQQKQETTLK